ncbi:hypothetical protein CVT24_007389 [Panaeolus cyanescens]|uniref:BTB domain-containing protein n=1 Tax=Panaeolus cyanescens TaxID=181874 RepID=A0A409YL08_9AGAR|nr:hypothetical protein CVT24_007389 [Panaeolus cyanescens]
MSSSHNKTATPGKDGLVSPKDDSSYEYSPFFLQTIDFLVENKRFRVPKVGFEGRKGSPFADAASIQAHSNGSSGAEDAIITLEGVKKEDFEALCHVMYRSIIPGYRQEIEKEEWKGAMRLANAWNFIDIREQAREALTEILDSAVELVCSGIELRVVNWLIQGIEAICRHDKPIHPTKTLVPLIGSFDIASRILYVRSQYQETRKQKVAEAKSYVTYLQKNHVGLAVDCSRCGTHGRLCGDEAFEDYQDDPLQYAPRFSVHSSYSKEGCKANVKSAMKIKAKPVKGGNQHRTPAKDSDEALADKMIRSLIIKEYKEELAAIKHDEEAFSAH